MQIGVERKGSESWRWWSLNDEPVIKGLNVTLLNDL